MKIAFIVHTAYPDFIGGREHHVHHLASALSKTDEVKVFAGGSNKTIEQRTINGYSLVTLPMISVRLCKNPLQIYRIIPSLYSWLNKERFDIIHAFEYGSFSTHIACFFAKRHSLPLFLTFYSYQLENPFLKVLKKIYDRLMGRALFKFAEKIICVSAVQHQEIINFGNAKNFKDKIIIQANCISTNEYETIPVSDELGLLRQDDKLKILTLTRILPRKGIKNLIYAMNEIIHKHKFNEVTLLLAGPDCGETDFLKEEVKRLKLQDSVFFMGPIAYERTKELIAISDIFVLPSLYEGLPLSVLEAMAAGKAVIFSKLPCSHELITHETDGLLVESGDINVLVQSILRLVRDKELRERLGRNAKSKAKKFDIHEEAERLRILYKQAVIRREKNM